MGRLDDEVVLVTGAARGLGRSHAIHLAREGADLVLLDVASGAPVTGAGYTVAKADELERTAEDVRALGRRAVVARVDVRDRVAMEDAVAAAEEALGPIDVAVANAGIAHVSDPWETPDDAWHAQIDVNLTGTWNTCRAVMPGMMVRGRGRIILISSIAATATLPRLAAYSAAKAGVLQLARCLALDLGQHGITVNAVLPGTVMTDINLWMPGDADAFMAGQMIASPIEEADISHAVVYLASHEARRVTGAALPVDAGVSAR